MLSLTEISDLYTKRIFPNIAFGNRNPSLVPISKRYIEVVNESEETVTEDVRRLLSIANYIIVITESENE